MIRVGALMASDWLKIRQYQLKAWQSRQNHTRYVPGLFKPKSGTMWGWPIGVFLACVLYLLLICNWFWHKSDQVYLILAKTYSKKEQAEDTLVPPLWATREKNVCFLPSERDREFLFPVFYTAAPKCVCIRRLAGARHSSPVVLWTLWPKGVSEPLTSAPRSDSWRSRCFLVDRCLWRTRNLAASK